MYVDVLSVGKVQQSVCEISTQQLELSKYKRPCTFSCKHPSSPIFIYYMKLVTQNVIKTLLELRPPFVSDGKLTFAPFVFGRN